MKHLILYGASDDLVEIEGDFSAEIDGERAELEVAGLLVTVEFEGCWSIKVVQMEEGIPVTAANMQMCVRKDGGEEGFSMQLEMDVPDDELRKLGRRVKQLNRQD